MTTRVQALVVGGPATLVMTGQLAHNLARVGIDVAWHYDYEKGSSLKRGLPRGCQLVIGLSSAASHRWIDQVREWGRTSDVPTVVSPHKWSTLVQHLQRVGMIKEPELSPGLVGDGKTTSFQLQNTTQQPPEVAMAAAPSKPPAFPPPGVGPKPALVDPPPSLSQVLERLKEVATELITTHDVTRITITPDEGIDIVLCTRVKVKL